MAPIGIIASRERASFNSGGLTGWALSCGQQRRPGPLSHPGFMPEGYQASIGQRYWTSAAALC
jgi:hypothetical protein